MKNSKVVFDVLKLVGRRWLMLYMVLLFFFVDATFFVDRFIFWGIPIKGIPNPLAIPERMLSLGEGIGFVTTLGMLLVALAGAILWACFDRDRQRERLFYEVTRILTRYGLAGAMLIFGVEKLFLMFFPPLEPGILLTPLGDLSAPQLMWAFMGYSPLYGNIFVGLGEVIPSLLLFFRRTTTLGALVIAGVMANVAMLNFVTHWPLNFVILFCGQMVLQALFLAAPDMLRLAPALVLYRSVPAVDTAYMWPKGWVSLVCKVLVIGWLLYPTLFLCFQMRTKFLAAQNMESDLGGLYRVERFSSTGKSGLLHMKKGNAWLFVAIEPNMYSYRAPTGLGFFDMHEILAVRTADAGNTMHYFPLRIHRIDATHGRFILMQSSGAHPPPLSDAYVDGPPFIVFRYVVVHRTTASSSPQPNNKVLVLDSKVGSTVISMRLDRMDTSKVPLMSNSGDFYWTL